MECTGLKILPCWQVFQLLYMPTSSNSTWARRLVPRTFRNGRPRAIWAEGVLRVGSQRAFSDISCHCARRRVCGTSAAERPVSLCFETLARFCFLTVRDP